MKWSALCIKMLEQNSWYPINITSSCKNGVSDIIAIRNGNVIFIECKEGKDVQSPLQKRFERKIKENKGIYIVAEKEKFTDFLNQIK